MSLTSIEAPVPDQTTRDRVYELIVSEGPISAREMAQRLALTAAGVRRHLAALLETGQITTHFHPPADRAGRGRPAQRYVATPGASDAASEPYEDLAIDVLTFLDDEGGAEAVERYAQQRMRQLEQRYAPQVAAAGDDIERRTEVLATALSADGFAATARTVHAGGLLQLCQGRCPVRHVAAKFPQLCEAETQMFARVLGVHVQRLATISGGEHVCTTSVPTALVTTEERDNSQTTAATSGRPEGTR